jgi:molecular chaperone DnaK (HSP70)
MLDSLSDYYQEEIRDVVITVPANFDPAMRLATLRAAELAGVNVRKPDGMYNDEEILLSEPEAVMYALINQVQNGEINIPIDFSSKKRVLVFDIGGGTLDITLHEVERSPENPDLFNITSLATNRYSNVAGDVFDSVLAEAMHKKYIAYYEEQDPSIARRIRSDRYAIPNLLMYAEELKLRISDQVKDFRRHKKTLPDDYQFDYGGTMSNGYNSEDMMTKMEFEECLSPLLAPRLKFGDYRVYDTLTDDRNIISPILNVLKKAAAKLGAEEPKVDAVILNGGMSRLYLIQERLNRFFGFHPITVTDPDLSVAQGAAVYHYYLHQQNSLMRRLHQRYMEELGTGAIAPEQAALRPRSALTSGIETKSNVLPEDLYLGLRGGSVHLLASAGQDLPFDSPVANGFLLAPGQKLLRIPIRHRIPRAANEYKTIASGDIQFARKYDTERYVSIKFHLSRNQILAFEAWCSNDDKGKDIVEKGSVAILIGDDVLSAPRAENSALPLSNAGPKAKKSMHPPSGTKLIVANELSIFKDRCYRLSDAIRPKKLKSQSFQKKLIEEMKQHKKVLAACGNPDEFAGPVLGYLKAAVIDIIPFNLLPIARKMCKYWTEAEKQQLAKYCMDLLKGELQGWPARGSKVNLLAEAIHTVGVCGTAEQCLTLTPLCANATYRAPLLNAFALQGINIDWIYYQFKEALSKRNPIQDSLRALGISMQRNRLMPPDAPDESEVVDDVVLLVESMPIQPNEIE